MTAWIVVVVGLGLPFYAYCVYPALLFMLAAMAQVGRDTLYLLRRRERRASWNEFPTVSLIIAAHNEESVIVAKMENCLALDYPADRIEILAASDGSTDRTGEIISDFAARHARVRAFVFAERGGKLNVLNRVVREAAGEILVFSDANTSFARDAARRLTRHFRHPRVGAVCGELWLDGHDGESIYWRYEMLLKFLESKLDSTLGANGAIYALRRELYPYPPAYLITDDFIIPMAIRARGWRVRYDPEATAREPAAPTANHEFRRRVRIGAGNLQALWRCRRLLLPWSGFVCFSFWSHKVARWFAPFLLAAGLAANFFVLDSPWGQALLAAQAVFYFLAFLGWRLTRSKRRLRVMLLPYYFVLINAGLAAGFFVWLFGRQRAAWERTDRVAGGGAQP